jgi:hypothetical protein
MLKQNSSTETQGDREIIITRVFNAPQELVFKAWLGLRESSNRLEELVRRRTQQ